MEFQVREFQEQFRRQLQLTYEKTLEESSVSERYMALVAVLREYIGRNWSKTNRQYRQKKERQVYYLSMEFLPGKFLDMNLMNLGIYAECRQALAEMGIELAALAAAEAEPGLGNGGLGRLASCFLDSLAAMHLPGHGCGIRYKYGLFEQKIIDHHQVELPDNWLKDGCPWEWRRSHEAVEVRFGGWIRHSVNKGRWQFVHEDYEPVRAVPYDIPLVGYQNRTVNTLRLWSAEPAQVDLELPAFNRGDYVRVVEYRHAVERISKILYPDDTQYEGRLLRLKQQYFFVSASIKSILAAYRQQGGSWRDIPEKICLHINDTHPALAVPELLRLLLDEAGLTWEEAWRITSNTISYTNHTVMPEALEKWPVEMVQQLLPRLYMLICEINERLCRAVFAKHGNWESVRRISIIENGYVHMAHLAAAACYSINGVSELHSSILKQQTFAGFYELYPYKFSNKTNGITHRRWLLKANPGLSTLLCETIGTSWIKYPRDLQMLVHSAGDASLLARLAAVRQANKQTLSRYIRQQYGIRLNEYSIFDVQVKRMHAYKRQLLNILHIMDLYAAMLAEPQREWVPRTFFFAGKAAPGYYVAKQTIKLIHVLAEMINQDPRMTDRLNIVFLENYNVSLAELLVTAADISEQISTAGKEASGTGNMKFMLNGAVTIGTLDGANVEIRRAVGEQAIFTFGLTAPQVADYYQLGGYRAQDYYEGDTRIKAVVDALINGFFAGQNEEFRPLYNELLLHNDEFFVLRDFASYAEAQQRAAMAFRSQEQWLRSSLVNIAKAGFFSSDRAISEYAVSIWKLKPNIIADC